MSYDEQTMDEGADTAGASAQGSVTGPTEVDRKAALKIEAGEASVRMSAVGYLSADSAVFKMSPAALTYARGPVELKFSSASVLASADDVHLQYSGSQIVAAKGDVRLGTAAAGAVLSGRSHVERGLVGLLIAKDVELGEGARVMLRPAGAAALGAGFAGGLLLAVAFLWRLFAGGLKRRGSGAADDD